MGRRKVRTGELRGEVLGVATRLLDDGGPDALTTRAVAGGAGTSLAAVHELFGGKPGLVRAIFADGFARLARELGDQEPSGDAEADVLALALTLRGFAHRHRHLYEVMFSRPFAEFHPDADDVRAAVDARRIVVARVAAALGPGRPDAEVTDAAIGLWGAVQGLVALETSGLLGSTPESADRRFRATVTATLRGFR